MRRRCSKGPAESHTAAVRGRPSRQQVGGAPLPALDRGVTWAGVVPSSARNGGWREGAGEWVQFLDADDLIAPQKVATQVQAASAAPADVAMVTSPWSSLIVKAGEWSSDDALVDPVIGPDPLMSVLRAEARGDLFVELQVETPVNLTKRQQELLREFEAAGKGKSHSPASEGFFAKVREFFEDLKE